MSRNPTGNPTGRPLHSGQLGLGTQDEQLRLSVRLPSALARQLEAYAEGRSYTRGVPQLAAAVREALVHFFACPHKRQTGSIPVVGSNKSWQTENSIYTTVHNDDRQKEGRPQPDTSGQTGSVPPLSEGERPLDVLALDAPPVDWQTNAQTAMDAVHATAPETLALMQALVDQDQAQAALVAAPPSTQEGPPQGDAADITRQRHDQAAPAPPGSMYPVPAPDSSPPDALPDRLQGKAALAARVRALRLTMSHGKIARQLTAEGVPTPGGKPGAKWSNSAVERLLKSEV